MFQTLAPVMNLEKRVGRLNVGHDVLFVYPLPTSFR